MKLKGSKIISICIFLLLLAVVVFIFFRNKERGLNTPKTVLETPFTGLIENSKKIRGTIEAAHIVDIKPHVSGIIDTVYVNMGEQIKNNQPIAKIRVIPSPDEIANAQKNVETSDIQYQLDKKLYYKNLGLYKKGGVSQSKLEEVKAKMEINKLNYDASVTKLKMLLESNVRGSKNEDFTIVRSTLNGIVLGIPFQEGSSVSKRTSTSDGTTIALVANMDSLIFESEINEFDIAKIYLGMKLSLSISSMDSVKLTGTISEISPQSKKEQGINQFKFLASFSQGDYNLHYSGITATADILLNKTDSVLCIKEKYLQFEKDKPYVEIWSNKETVKSYVETGLSDGINVEINKGLDLNDKLVLPDWKEK